MPSSKADPTEFNSPLLIAATRQMSQASEEMDMIVRYRARHANAEPDDIEAWAGAGITASAIHNIYHGMEQVMKLVCKNVDGHVPAGKSSHQEILDQVAVRLPGKRPALITPESYDDVKEIKGFKHFINHNYAVSLDPARVEENFERLQRAFPAFQKAMKDLDTYLTDPGDEPEEDEPASTPGL